jgi:hypothetical protein
VRDGALETLEGLQRFVTHAVMRTSSVRDDPEVAAVAARLLVPSARGMEPAERLEVYQQQFWLRHLSNLQDDFPTLIWAVGGAARFRDLATNYLGAHPPVTWDLQRLGQGLPAYVARETPWREDDLVRDAARLDWAFMEAFDAPDAAPLDPRRFAAIPEDTWPRASVVFHPSLRALVLAYPAHHLREALKRGIDVERPAAASSHVVVWRDAACVLQATPIEHGAWQILAALASGASLGEACEAVARGAVEAEMAELGPRVANWFQQWTANGWVCAIRAPGRITVRSAVAHDEGGS